MQDCKGRFWTVSGMDTFPLSLMSHKFPEEADDALPLTLGMKLISHLGTSCSGCSLPELRHRAPFPVWLHCAIIDNRTALCIMPHTITLCNQLVQAVWVGENYHLAQYYKHINQPLTFLISP